MRLIKHLHLGIIAAFFAIYMVTFSYIENRDVHHYIVHTVLDEKIPFCEYFIIPYLLWFIFVAVTVLYFMFFNQNKWKECYQLMITLGIGMTLFLVISLVFPNGQDLRPVLSGNSIFIQAVQFYLSYRYTDKCTAKYSCIQFPYMLHGNSSE